MCVDWSSLVLGIPVRVAVTIGVSVTFDEFVSVAIQFSVTVYLPESVALVQSFGESVGERIAISLKLTIGFHFTQPLAESVILGVTQ